MNEEHSVAPQQGPLRVVALGGGHGLAASLQALRSVADDITAVVTVADDGGSSGRLRREFDVLPPGDLRMALAALCGDDEWGRTWARLLQHRFASDGDLDGHALGNLLIVGLWDQLGDQVSGLSWVARLLGAQGNVLPMALSPLDITARVLGAEPHQPDAETEVRGQVEVATTTGRVLSVALDPPDAAACPEALEAIALADWVVLGPGSWYSSVIPHLLVPRLRQALESTSARVLVNLNLVSQPGETEGMTPADHIDALMRHAPGLKVDTLLADRQVARDDDRLERVAAEAGARLSTADLTTAGAVDQHDPDKLAAAYARVMGAA